MKVVMFCLQGLIVLAFLSDTLHALVGNEASKKELQYVKSASKKTTETLGIVSRLSTRCRTRTRTISYKRDGSYTVKENESISKGIICSILKLSGKEPLDIDGGVEAHRVTTTPICLPNGTKVTGSGPYSIQRDETTGEPIGATFP